MRRLLLPVALSFAATAVFAQETAKPKPEDTEVWSPVPPVVTPAGAVTTIAGGKSRARAFADGAGPDAKFNNPAGIAVDASGVIYVADVMNNRIRKLQ